MGKSLMTYFNTFLHLLLIVTKDVLHRLKSIKYGKSEIKAVNMIINVEQIRSKLKIIKYNCYVLMISYHI